MKSKMNAFLLFALLCLAGAIALVVGRFIGDSTIILGGYILSTIGVNLSILNPLNFAPLVCWGLYAFFFGDLPFWVMFSSGVIFIDLFVAFSLFSAGLSQRR